MRARVAGAAALLITILFFLSSQFGLLGPTQTTDTSNAKIDDAYPYVRPVPFTWHPPSPDQNKDTEANTTQPDRIIFLTKFEREDASWLSGDYPEWRTVVSSLGSNFALLHPGSQVFDKGRIANAYLTYIIENYYHLPSTIVFLNPYRKGHPLEAQNNPSGYDKFEAVQNLNTDFIQSTGFANLRCISEVGCLHKMLPMRDPPDEYRTLEVALPKVWKELFDNDQVPPELATPCCAEFAVSREQVQKKTPEEYMKYWEWLNKTKMDDDTAGLVMEYLWHIIFGQEAVYCPELRACECDLYGRC